MASAFKVKPSHKAVKSYYAALATYADQSVEHEGALRSAFQSLLSETGRKVGWTLIPELSLDANAHQIRPDGTFRDEFTIERGHWEAKDTGDDLEAEIKKVIDALASKSFNRHDSAAVLRFVGCVQGRTLRSR